MAVPAGDAAPDISNLEVFKQTLLTAKRVALAASASGIYLRTQVSPKLGITEEMSRTAFTVYSERVGHVLARGKADLRFQQVSEILSIKTVKLIGMLPAELRKPFYFNAAIGAHCTQPDRVARVKQFLRFLASTEVALAIKQAWSRCIRAFSARSLD